MVKRSSYGSAYIQSHFSWRGAASSTTAAAVPCTAVAAVNTQEAAAVAEGTEVQAAVAEGTNPGEHRNNCAPEVGNFGIYFGNWGKRPEKKKKPPQA